ncbi:MAG: hypothetical protein JEY96_15060 [Bacteroidales bacterium]|nr:hypothetical protein [Bacteroidales bacterium]
MKNIFVKLETINFKEYFLLYALLNGLFLFLLYGVIADPIAYVGDSPKTIKFYNVFTTVIYFISPFYEYLKIYLLAKIIQKGIDNILKIKSDAKVIFLIVLTSQFSMLLADVVKAVWLLFVQTDLQMHDRKHFTPLSLLNLFERKNITTTYYYPLKFANVFELLYWIILSLGIAQLFNTTRKKAFWIVFRTYGFLIVGIMLVKLILNSTFFGF